MRIIRKAEMQGSARHVRNDVYETTRLLLAADDAGASVTDILLQPGIEAEYGYADRTEIAYCIEGEATLVDPDGQTHAIAPGTMWVARPGERFRFEAAVPTRLICVFTPPLAGDETGFASDMAAHGAGERAPPQPSHPTVTAEALAPRRRLADAAPAEPDRIGGGPP
jgi:L-ectoine synthase